MTIPEQAKNHVIQLPPLGVKFPETVEVTLLAQDGYWWAQCCDHEGDLISGKGTTKEEAIKALEVALIESQAWAQDDPLPDWNRATKPPKTT